MSNAMKPIMVAAELSRDGVEWSALDYWTGCWGTCVERFVGKTTMDLARFLRWAEDNRVTFRDVSSEEGQSRNVTAGLTLIGFGRRRTGGVGHEEMGGHPR